MVESAWSLLPPIITIVLALATKEVYMSLIVGIFVGTLMFTGFDILVLLMHSLQLCLIKLAEMYIF